MPPFTDDINSHDLSEAPRLAKDSQPKGPIIGIIAAVLLLIGLLIYASFPELSPEEIISMDGYEGEQPTKHIFNLQSLEESKAVAKADVAVSNGQSDVPQDVAVETVETPIAPSLQTPVEESPVVEIVPLPQDQSPILDPEPQPEPEVLEVVTPEPSEPAQSEEQPLPVAESVIVPVANEPARVSQFDKIPEQRVVASKATTPKLEEQPGTVVISTAVVDELAPMSIGSSVSSALENKNTRLLPLRRVLEDSTALKSAADTGSSTVMLLGKGVVVSAFERQGEWIYVGTNDDSSATGYVRESSLGKVEPK